jgi:hypothetical protein
MAKKPIHPKRWTDEEFLWNDAPLDFPRRPDDPSTTDHDESLPTGEDWNSPKVQEDPIQRETVETIFDRVGNFDREPPVDPTAIRYRYKQYVEDFAKDPKNKNKDPLPMDSFIDVAKRFIRN